MTNLLITWTQGLLAHPMLLRVLVLVGIIMVFGGILAVVRAAQGLFAWVGQHMHHNGHAVPNHR